MVSTLLVLLVALLVIAGIVAVVRSVIASRTRREGTPGGPFWGDDPLAWLPLPPGATERRTERFGAGSGPGRNPTPAHSTSGIEAVARWYDAPMRYPEVAGWYAARLAADGWTEEPGHDAIRVFRRDDTLLWLTGGEDPTVWLRTFAGVVPMPRTVPGAPEAAPPAFTVLSYRTVGVQPLGGGWLGKI